MNIFRSILGATPFMAVGMALASAEVSMADWTFWAILVSLFAAALFDYGRSAE